MANPNPADQRPASEMKRVDSHSGRETTETVDAAGTTVVREVSSAAGTSGR